MSTIFAVLRNHERVHTWSDILGLDRCYRSVRDIEGVYDETCRLRGHGRWSVFNSADLAEMSALLEHVRRRRQRVLFEVEDNERVWYWQVVHWERMGVVKAGTTRRFRESIREPFRRQVAERHPEFLEKSGPRVAVHVRNSAWGPHDVNLCRAEKDGIARMAELLDTTIDVYSEGQEADFSRIRDLYSGVPT